MHGNRFKIGLFLRGQLMDLQSCFNLLWGHLLTKTIFAIYADTLLFFGRHETLAVLASEGVLSAACSPSRALRSRRHIHLGCQFGVFINLLLSVPEPFVDLVFL